MFFRFASIGACIAALSVPAAADVLTFDQLSQLPPLAGSQTFDAANGGSAVWQGVLFPSTFAVAGRNKVVTSAEGAFLAPHSGNYAGYGYKDTVLQTRWRLQDLYLGSTSLNAVGDGASALTIQALGASQAVLGEIAVTGLNFQLTWVDTRAFNALSGVEGYRFRIDRSGSELNPRFAVDDLRFVQSVPEPGSLALLAMAGLACAWTRRRAGGRASPR